VPIKQGHNRRSESKNFCAKEIIFLAIDVAQKQDGPQVRRPKGKKNPPAFEREEDVAFYPGLKMKKI